MLYLVVKAKLDGKFATFFQDFIDAYLIQMKKDPSVIERDDLIGICLDFFEAGGDTVGSTLSWVFLYMALYPEEQEKCYNEIVKQLGNIINYQLADKIFPIDTKPTL